MLTKRIIPCLDVRDDKVVKGIKFGNHRIIGDILPLASRYSLEGADELVFYDITASGTNRPVSVQWVKQVAETINIPFTVAGGIRSLISAQAVLNAGADKISINSPALENPNLINEFSDFLGSQCVVIGVDSQWIEDDYYVFQYTGDVEKTKNSLRKTRDWIQEIQDRGAGEIVLNCMQSDGVREGYALEQLQCIRSITQIPLIASGGAGTAQDFVDVFTETQVDGALAASIFHDKLVSITEVKHLLKDNKIEVRL